MGPRLCSRGNGQRRGNALDDHSRLQWGHDFAAVEMVVLDESGILKSFASMGPRLCSRGNRSFAISSVVKALCASMGPRLCSRGNIF